MMTIQITPVRFLASAVLALSLLSGCSHPADKSAENDVSKANRTPAEKAEKPSLIDELDARLPKDWHRGQQGEYVLYQPPERNTTLAIASFPPATVEQEIKRASQDMAKIVPGFKPKVKRVDNRLSKEGLGKVKVYFESGGDEDYIRLADLYRERGVTHINLASLHYDTYQKRRGQVGAFVKPIADRLARVQGDVGRAKPVDIASKATDIDAYIKRAVTELGVPGIAVGIVQNGKAVFQKAYGVKSLPTKEPVTIDTKFAIGSTTKPLSSLLAAKLVEEGKLSWDQKVAAQLPDWQGARHPVLSQITQLQSFCACTGYPRRDKTFSFNPYGVSALERINEMASWQPNAKMGELYQYSNHMFAVGGYSAARAYLPNQPIDKAYRRALTDLVLKPLGMTATAAERPKGQDMALPHAQALEGGYEVIPEAYRRTYETPAGAVWSTVPDMLKLLQFELSKGESVPGYISEKNLLIRRQPRTTMAATGHYGLGLVIDKEDGRTRIGHGGNTKGFTSYFSFFPADDWGYVILGNYGHFRNFGNLITAKIEYAAYEREFKGDHYLDKVAKATKRSQKQNRQFLSTIRNPRQLIGQYHNPELGGLRIFKKAGTPPNTLWADIGDYAAELREIPSTKGQPRKFVLVPTYASVGLLEFKGGTFTTEGTANKYVFNKTR